MRVNTSTQISEEVVNCILLTTPSTHIYPYSYNPMSEDLILKSAFRTHEQTLKTLNAILEKKLASMVHPGLATNRQMDNSGD